MNIFPIYIYMWQSRIEIEYYSVAYFERITEFDALWRWASAKSRTHTRYINALMFDASMKKIVTLLNIRLFICKFTVRQGKRKPNIRRQSVLLTHDHAMLSLVPSPLAAEWGLSHASSKSWWLLVQVLHCTCKYCYVSCLSSKPGLPAQWKSTWNGSILRNHSE